MNKKANQVTKKALADAESIDALYVEFLNRFYDDGDREAARKIASRLRAALAVSPDFADSIRGEEIRSLLAELDGDFQAAIRSREAEIRKILELHTLSVGTASWAFVAQEYDFSDVSDRLDLLALLYRQQGDRERTLATLRESRQYCLSHQIAFDSQDLLDDFERSRPAATTNGVAMKKKRMPRANKTHTRTAT